ncbi:MAG TPA: Gfo/Idh/MocA family oxidoreductase [Candidatus Sulfotelmatobacter sp.]|jgi:predicted dehydrogenase|nr:Gfo/Idh/MocA family oxidoreductase [Candidatus Sulfotelmatobacter sp.]
MTDATRRTFLKQAAIGAAVLAYPSSKVLGANNRVRVGMIGVGDRGNDLLDQVVKVPNIELVAMADVYSRRRDQAKSKVPGIQTLDDYRRLLDMKDIDGVIVASPLHIHNRHFLDTLAAGKDLYSEKTMTWSIPEADKCLAAAKASDRVVQIGLQHESTGAYTDARQMIKDGWLGKVTHVESWMSRNTPHGKGQWVRPVPSDCTAQNVDWKAFLNGRPDPGFDGYKLINWRLFWEFSGGNCAENMVHQIAWIMSVLDLPLPSAAYMSGGIYSEKDGREVPDTIAVTFDFPDLVVTWQSTFSNRHYELGDRILGSDGTLEHHFEDPIQYWPEKVNRPNGEAVKGKSPNRNHMQNWIDCIRTRATPNAPVDIGYRSAIAVHMANLSYRNKRRLTLEEAKAITPEYS